MDFTKAFWRKTTDVNREHSIFELVLADVILLDLGFSDDEVLEIAFHEGIGNTVTNWDSFLLVLDNGKKIAEADK